MTPQTVEAIHREMASLRIEARRKDAFSARFYYVFLKNELRRMASAEKRIISQVAEVEKRKAKRAARAAQKSL